MMREEYEKKKLSQNNERVFIDKLFQFRYSIPEIESSTDN